MRPIWKGHISFGLVNIPVNLFPAERRTDIQLHMIDSRDLSRVRYERVNAETGEEVPWAQVVKGYEYADGNYVVVGEDELKKAAPKQTQTIAIEAFVNLNQIDLVYFDKPYYIAPAKGGEKGYALLREVLRESGRAGIAKVVIRTRQYIAAMVPRGDTLVLNLLRYSQEILPTKNLELPGSLKGVGVSAAEHKLARTLVDSMAAEWKPSEYQDEFRDSLMQWIQKRIKAGDVHEVHEGPTEADDAPAPISIMDALRKSLDKPNAVGGKGRLIRPSASRTKRPSRKRKAG